MFENTNNLFGNIGNWNVSKVMNAPRMFNKAVFFGSRYWSFE